MPSLQQLLRLQAYRQACPLANLLLPKILKFFLTPLKAFLVSFFSSLILYYNSKWSFYYELIQSKSSPELFDWFTEII